MCQKPFEWIRDDKRNTLSRKTAFENLEDIKNQCKENLSCYVLKWIN